MVSYLCSFSIQEAEAEECVYVCCLSAYPHMQATVRVEIRGQFTGISSPCTNVNPGD